jgi:hypothetical protein
MKRQPDDPGLQMLPLDVAGAIDIIDEYIEWKKITKHGRNWERKVQTAEALRAQIILRSERNMDQ